jgi:hypothetical protein
MGLRCRRLACQEISSPRRTCHTTGLRALHGRSSRQGAAQPSHVERLRWHRHGYLGHMRDRRRSSTKEPCRLLLQLRCRSMLGSEMHLMNMSKKTKDGTTHASFSRHHRTYGKKIDRHGHGHRMEARTNGSTKRDGKRNMGSRINEMERHTSPDNDPRERDDPATSCANACMSTPLLHWHPVTRAAHEPTCCTPRS